MKRFAQFHKISIPSDDNWHFELMESFCDPPKDGLPLLIDQDLAQDLAPYRHFRHVVHHNYGVGLDWNKMLPGVQQVESVWQKFKRATEDYLTTIPC